MAIEQVSVTDTDQVVKHVATLGDPRLWPEPVTISGPALCLINSIYSTGNTSKAVRNVLSAYRARRRAAGADPEQDGPLELRAEIESCDGPEGFTNETRNHTRAWQRMTAPYKAQVVYEATELLISAGLTNRDDLMLTLADPQQRISLEQQWRKLPGQRGGLTWNYFLMNAGIPGIKADRMITRWVGRALGRDVSSREAARLLLATADRLGLDARRLDRAVWSVESA